MNAEFPVRQLLVRNMVTLLGSLRLVFGLYNTIHENYFETTHDYRKGGSDKGVTAVKLLRKFGLHKAHTIVNELEDVAAEVEGLLVHSTDLTDDAIDEFWRSKTGVLSELISTHDVGFIQTGRLPRSFADMLSPDLKQRLQDSLLYGDDDETDSSPE